MSVWQFGAEYRCNVCGNKVMVIKVGGGTLICCNTEMEKSSRATGVDARVGDVMTTNVVTIPSNTSLSEAKGIMDSKHFRRLPVVDSGKLVGIVTEDRLNKAGPSQLTTFSIHELAYLVNKIKVRDVMRRDVFTATPDMTIRETVALGQSRKTGSTVVLEANKVVGIMTTNDIFYKVLNPLFGIEVPGSQKQLERDPKSNTS